MHYTINRRSEDWKVRGSKLKTNIKNSKLENQKNRDKIGVGCVFSVCAAQTKENSYPINFYPISHKLEQHTLPSPQ